jgi:RNA-directed DNA polymerase
MSTVAQLPMYGWDTIPWKKLRRSVFKLQKRIYRATLQGNGKSVRKLQRLLMSSRAAKLLAVRRVAQDNSGKKTAGVDGVKALTKHQRLRMAQSLSIDGSAKPVRRVWIDKADSEEKRPLGIPVMVNRARQTLVKEALEPEWEARFEANSYGFRPGRSCHDAVAAIFTAIKQKGKYVLDADIAKCYDRIEQRALLDKVNASPFVQRQIRAWLKAGVLDGEQLFPTEEGVMQGSPLSPLLANIALHGLETAIVESFPWRRGCYPPSVVRYADDFVILHSDKQVIEQGAEVAREWLKPLGLELKASKTRIAHTLEKVDGQAGFDFLGFNIRQYKVGHTKSGKNAYGKFLGFKTLIKPSPKAIGKHVKKLGQVVDSHQSSRQEKLIHTLNPVIRGWANYYSTVVSKRTFASIDHRLFLILGAWAKHRHPNKGKRWSYQRYWGKNDEQVMVFRPPAGPPQLRQHDRTPIRRHVKVQAKRSPYDGDWLYWSIRRGRSPEVSPRVAKLLKKQTGRCIECGLYFRDGEPMEVDYVNPEARIGKEAYYNLMLVHRYCQKQRAAEFTRLAGTYDQRQEPEEPYEGKLSRTVLKPSGGGDPVA